MMKERIEPGQESSAQGGLDLPRAGEKVYEETIAIAGWVRGRENILSSCRIRAWIDNVCIGQAEIVSERPDQVGNRVSYRILGRFPEPIESARDSVITITYSENESAEQKIAEVAVELVPARLRQRDYGEVVPPTQETVLHRENIYGSGPPVEQPSPEILKLILGYLPPRSSVVDVGCGAGVFSQGLMEAGHKWLGLEVNDYCIELLGRRNLPHRKLQGASPRFPCVDREFDHAICIEVLEHVEDPAEFLDEIARVVRGRALFSVPNIEVIPYFKSWDVVPWHLLEGSHRNFFTRASLRTLLKQHFRRVEVFSYGMHPLPTRDEIALPQHFFAVAEL